MFKAGFVDLQEIYINDLDLASITETSVASLSSIDSGITVTRDGANLQVAVGGAAATAYEQPPPGDAEAWGALTGEMITHLQRQSAALGSSDEERIYETVFDAVVRGLDPYSRYSSRDEAQENRASRDGFGGIGVRIDVLPEGIKVLSVMENTPAAVADLHDGDMILAIDGQPTANIDQREAVDRLRGRVGSVVKLSVQRDAKILDVNVTRAHIVPQTVKGSLQDGIAIVELSSFNHSTSEVLEEKILALQAQAGGHLRGLVLDLRGNPGGLLDQSVEVSDMFLTSGVIVTTHGRHPDSHQYFDADGNEIVAGVPMVILINGTSASASEIVAAALQDQGRAVVVGSSSYGKGTVQTVLRLPNDGELTLTWARFHAPSGYPLERARRAAGHLHQQRRQPRGGPARGAARRLSDLAPAAGDRGRRGGQAGGGRVPRALPGGRGHARHRPRGGAGTARRPAALCQGARQSPHLGRAAVTPDGREAGAARPAARCRRSGAAAPQGQGA